MNTKSLFLLVLITFTCCKQLRFLEEANNGKLNAEEVYKDLSNVADLLNKVNERGATRFMGYAGMIVDAAITIVNTFKSSKSEVLEKVIKGEGYKTFVGEFEFDFTIGFRELGYNYFVEKMIEDYEIPEKYQEGFIASLLTGGMTKEKEIFSDNSFLTKKPETNAKGNQVLSYFNIMIYHYRKDHKNKFDAIISRASAEVKLFPDQFIFKTRKNSAGGIRQEESYKTKWEDKNITAEDIQALMDFFQYESYKELVKLFGIVIDIVI